MPQECEGVARGKIAKELMDTQGGKLPPNVQAGAPGGLRST